MITKVQAALQHLIQWPVLCASMFVNCWPSSYSSICCQRPTCGLLWAAIKYYRNLWIVICHQILVTDFCELLFKQSGWLSSVCQLRRIPLDHFSAFQNPNEWFTVVCCRSEDVFFITKNRLFTKCVIFPLSNLNPHAKMVFWRSASSFLWSYEHDNFKCTQCDCDASKAY